jgi:hypothetical protein
MLPLDELPPSPAPDEPDAPELLALPLLDEEDDEPLPELLEPDPFPPPVSHFPAMQEWEQHSALVLQTSCADRQAAVPPVPETWVV